MASDSPRVRWKASPIRIRSPQTLIGGEPRREDHVHRAAETEEEERIRQSFFESILTESASLMFEAEVQTPPAHIVEQCRKCNDVLNDQAQSSEIFNDEEMAGQLNVTSKLKLGNENQDANSDGDSRCKIVLAPQTVPQELPSIASHNLLDKIDHRLEEAYRYLAQVDAKYPSSLALPSSVSAIPHIGDEGFSRILEKVMMKIACLSIKLTSVQHEQLIRLKLFAEPSI